jgi:hypothetical protein
MHVDFAEAALRSNEAKAVHEKNYCLVNFAFSSAEMGAIFSV